MKNWKSVPIKTNNSKAPKKVFTQFNIRYMALFGSALFLMTACEPDTSSEDALLIVEPPTITLDSNLQEVGDIGESIENSYAILASKRSDICPKLIQKEVDSQIIKRASEVMVNNHCDYFLYPNKGQNISVSVSDDQIEALLVVPTLHNFADGGYQANSYDKHIIRLNYSGATHKPEKFTYDVVVTVSD